ncbi:MAG TPA: hypothetical protein VMI73_01005, partial [Trebonia sp.]|nr:hypothetical protein [Trebonia sp.]
IAVPLAIPVVLAGILGVVIAVSGGNHATNVNQSALDNCASPSASASAVTASPAASASQAAPASPAAPASATASASPAPCPSATASTNVVATASPSAPAVNPEAGRPGLAMTNPVDPTGAAINLNQTAAEAADSLNCTLTVPDNPLSAQGLATPWQLGDGCAMSNASQQAFVEATILAPNGKVQVYAPLVITQGTTPVVAPTAPTIARGSQIIINTGFNGNNLVLLGAGAAQGNCIDAFGNSIISQTAACNARAFYANANAQIAFGRLRVPRLGTASDGKACETTLSFSLIDQDQSDNVISSYLMDANGNTAQNTAANKAAMAGATTDVNGSDDGLLAHFVDPNLGCKPFTATDTTSPNGADASQALNALSAKLNQRGMQALLPVNDPQLLVGGQFSIGKTNTFRMMNDQPLLSPFTNKNQNAATYCQNMLNVQTPKLVLDAATEANFTSPVPDVGNNLATFMGARLSGSFANMNCQNFGLKDPTTVTTDGNGVATAVTYNTTPQRATAQGGGNGVHRGRHRNPIYFFFGRQGHKENGAGM